MTQPTNSVASVHTTDATPDAPTYKISAQPGEDTATVTVALNPGNAPLRPGVGVRPGAGVQPSRGTFDVGGALPGGDLTPDMVPYVAAYRMTTGLRATGKLVGNRGAVCGLDRCGAPGVMPMKAYSKRTGRTVAAPNIVDTVLWSELQLADGDVTINVYALIEPEGWI